MRNRTRLSLAALATALVLAVAGSTASANRLSLSSREFTFAWRELSFVTGIGTVRCAVTLAGTFHSRTFTKVLRALTGSVTSATSSSCTGGSATVLTASLPWHLTYNGFTGTLPRPTGVGALLTGLSLQVNIGGVVCLFRTSAAEPTGGTLTLDPAGEVDAYDISPEFEIDLDTPEFLCDIAGDGAFDGTAAVTTTPAGYTLRATPAGEIALDSLHAITFTSGELSMTCNWTLTGSLRSEAITVAEGATIGSISSTSHDRCGGGSVEAVLGTPWSLKYVSATGTIPGSVTALTLTVEGYAVNLKSLGSHVGCLYRGDLTGTLELSGANPYPTGLWRLSEPRLTKVSGEGGCPASITATGTYWLGPEQEIRFATTGGGAISVRLI